MFNFIAFEKSQEKEVDSLCLTPFSGQISILHAVALKLEGPLQKTNVPQRPCLEPLSDSSLLSGSGEISSIWRMRLGPSDPAPDSLAATSLPINLCSLGSRSLAT